jgi:hypothetical protein
MVDELTEGSIATAGRHVHAMTGNLPMTSSAMTHDSLFLVSSQAGGGGKRRQREHGEACKGPHYVDGCEWKNNRRTMTTDQLERGNRLKKGTIREGHAAHLVYIQTIFTRSNHRA